MRLSGFFGLCALVFVGCFGWFIGNRLSADAIGMSVGILFGILAGIPAALMVLASRRQADDYARQEPKGGTGYQAQAPIIIFAGLDGKVRRAGQLGDLQEQRRDSVDMYSTGKGIEQFLNEARLGAECIREFPLENGRKGYDFTVRIGVKISEVEAFVKTYLEEEFGIEFLVYRAGSVIRIEERGDYRKPYDVEVMLKRAEGLEGRHRRKVGSKKPSTEKSVNVRRLSERSSQWLSEEYPTE